MRTKQNSKHMTLITWAAKISEINIPSTAVIFHFNVTHSIA